MWKERTPRIAITAGEPAGIGPDLCILAAREDFAAQLVVIADADLLAERAGLLGEHVTFKSFRDASPAVTHRAGTLEVLSVRVRHPVVPGLLDSANAAYVLETLAAGCDGCLEGRFDALVTGPVHKGIINEAGFSFTGHTEFLADRCGAAPVMMLAAPGLRVALATTHVPLAEVSAHISAGSLEQVIRILTNDLREKFGIRRPRVLVCGLNPHCGEGGHLGREEIDVIEPVLDGLRDEGLDLLGPIPADTAFIPERLAQVDAVLAMYHDQGLPVLKHLGFGRAVNITLGLPIIRTSVDHGTALDRAGTGSVDTRSLLEAIATAADMVRRSAA